METYIYILTDPTTSDIRYVGKADRPMERFNRHVRDTSVTHKTCWIKQLKQLGLLPKIEIIACVPKENWKCWEKYYISYYKSIGCKLVNIAEGGLGGGNTFWKGRHRSVATRTKISNALKGRVPAGYVMVKLKESKGYLKRTQKVFDRIGEKNSKLSIGQVLDIRSAFFNIKWGEKSKIELLLSEKYNVSTRTIRGVVKKEVWRHVN